MNPRFEAFLQAVSGLFAVLVLLSFIGLPAVVGPQPTRSPEVKEMSNLKQVVLILRQYASKHDGAFPARISDLPPETMPPAILQFHDPSMHEPHDWLYFPGHTAADPPTTILAASPVPFHIGWGGPEQRIVVFVDDSAKIMHEADFQKLLSAQRK